MRWTLRLLLAGLLLALVLTRVDLEQVAAGLRSVKPGLLLVAIILTLAFRYLLAFQMSLALAPLSLQLGTGHLLKIGLISGFYSLVLPGGMLPGAAATWYKLSRVRGTAAEAGALVVYLRLVNTLTMLAIGLVALLFDSSGIPGALRAVVAGMFAIGLLAVVPFLWSWLADHLAGLVGGLSRRWAVPVPVRNGAAALWHSVAAFHRLGWRRLASIVALSLLSNLVGVLVWFVLSMAEGLSLSLLAVGWVSSLLAIVQLVPITVAGLGTREAALVILMGHYGISQEKALSFSFAVFGLMVVFALVGGLLEGLELVRRRGAPSAQAPGAGDDG